MSELPWSFTATCPNGHDDAQQSFERHFLEGCLRFGAPIRFYCSKCAAHWDATQNQRQVLAGAINTAMSDTGFRLKKRMPL